MGLRNKQRDRKNAREYYLKVTKAKRMIAREVRDITRQHFKYRDLRNSPMTLKTFKCRFVRVEHRPGFKDEEKVVAIKEVYANSVADAETIARSIAENDRIQWKCPINYTRIDVVQVQTKVPA